MKSKDHKMLAIPEYMTGFLKDASRLKYQAQAEEGKMSGTHSMKQKKNLVYKKGENIMNIFLYILTIISFLMMYEEKEKGKKDTYSFVFATILVVLVIFNLFKGVM